jgi:hypothetical protein
MSKVPPKAATGSTPQTRATSGKTCTTRATTASLVACKNLKHGKTPNANEEHNRNEGAGGYDVATETQVSVSQTSKDSPLHRIAATLAQTIHGANLSTSVKQSIESVIDFARAEDTKVKLEQVGTAEPTKVNEIRKAIFTDLEELYCTLAGHIIGIQETSKETLTVANKALKEAEDTKVEVKELANKVRTATEATNKIASETTSYQDAVLARPTQSIRVGTDPKVLSDMERHAKQIWVDIYDDKCHRRLDCNTRHLRS